jgi:hypothetical protein
VFVAKENLHFTVELEHNPPYIMSASRIAVHFFNGFINATSYTEMLEVWLIQLRDRRLRVDIWLQCRFILLACPFEQTFSRPLDWLCVTNILHNIILAII